MFRRTPVLLLALALVAGCSSGGDADDDGASLGDTAPLSEVTAPPAPETSAAGTGVVVIGGLTNPFSVTECVLEPAADDPTTLVLVTGAGTTVAGVPFQVQLQRVAAETGAAETFTDLITYTDTARILQLQRSEVDGEVNDIREPDARGSLLRVRDGGVSAVGIGGPPGAGGEDTEGLVGMAVDASC
jgi:hypothetical protein